MLNITTALMGKSLMTVLLPSIINQYMLNSYCLTIVADKAFNFNTNLSFTLVTPMNELEMFSNQLLNLSERGCSDYIVNMRDPQKFMTALHQVSRKGIVRRSDKKIIILPTAYANTVDYENSCLDLLSKKETSKVANILIIMKNKNNSTCEMYDLVTHEFLKLENDEPLLLDRWNSCTHEFERNENLYPHNITNLKGKTLQVAAYSYKPYVFLNLDPALMSSGTDGIEPRIVEEFCRWTNCSIEIINEEKGLWGEIFENGTGVGVIGSIGLEKTDIGIAGLYSWHELFAYMDFSAACTKSSIFLVAPSPQLLSSLKMPLMPFSWNMWFAVLLTVVSTCTGLILAKGCSSDKVILAVFGILLSQDIGSTWRIRSIVGWLLSGSLVLVSAYGAGLAAIFTVPKYESSIDTIQDMVDRKMVWGGTHDAWIFSLIPSEEPLIKQLVSQFRKESPEELKRRSFMRNMAFGVEKLPAGHFAENDYITKEALLDMTIMLEELYYGYCVIMLRMNSPYTEKLNELVGRLHQSGLLLWWETEVTLKYMDYEKQLELKLSRSKNEVAVIHPLSLRSIEGTFVMLAFGVAISTLCFIGELMYTKVVKKIKQNK